MFDRYAASVRHAWDALVHDDRQNLLNEHIDFILGDSYVERRGSFDRVADYRPAEYFVCDGLLLLAIGKGGTRVGEILQWAARIAARVHDGNPATIVSGDHTTPSAAAFIAFRRLEALLYLAVAQTALEGRAPDRHLLRNGATALDHAFANFPGRHHDADRKALMLGVLCALLAQELELATSLLKRAKTCPSHPRHLALFKHIIASARPVVVDGQTFLRVTDEAVREEFFSLFNIYRLPLDQKRADLIGEGGRQEFPLAPTPLGNYVFSWCYLLLFAEPLATQMDRDGLREIMTG
jgi:hypothetical protein